MFDGSHYSIEENIEKTKELVEVLDTEDQNSAKEDKNFLKQALQAEMAQEMADALLHGYAKDYKVEVNYGRMGIND